MHLKKKNNSSLSNLYGILYNRLMIFMTNHNITKAKSSFYNFIYFSQTKLLIKALLDALKKKKKQY